MQNQVSTERDGHKHILFSGPGMLTKLGKELTDYSALSFEVETPIYGISEKHTTALSSEFAGSEPACMAWCSIAYSARGGTLYSHFTTIFCDFQ